MESWDYSNQFEWMKQIKDGIGPLIISAADKEDSAIVRQF